jgi:5-methylthioadenosine/S-adenosylhomocysteine deaminase
VLRKHLGSAVLLVCFSIPNSAAQQKPEPVVLRGTVVTPEAVLPDGLIVVSGNKIGKVSPASGKAQAAGTVDTDSFIFPGLIDLHDHITWNLFPRWKPGELFSNRYEWQQRKDYKAALDGPHLAIAQDHGLICDADRFGEIKAIVGGATSVVGSLNPTPNTNDNACIEGLARNLDDYSGFDGALLNHEKVRYEVFPFEMQMGDAAQIRPNLDSGNLKAFLVHVAEGRPAVGEKPADAASAREFRMFAKRDDGFLHAGVSIIHGTALGQTDFQQMADAGVGLIWSPRSNIELYGATTDVRSAKAVGVKIALAPDWSPSGSDGMIEELNYAAAWNASQNPPVFGLDGKELVEMATVVPAQLAGVNKQIGSIHEGLYADLLLIKKSGTDAYQALLHASPADVRLVMIGGIPVYGDKDLMERLFPGHTLEMVVVCGKSKALYVDPQAGIAETQKSFKEISQELGSKLTALGSSLSELAPCQATNVN